MKKICITGVSGFIGQNLFNKLLKLNRTVVGTVRNFDYLSYNKNFKYISVGDIGPETNWHNALEEVDCIVHCAGKVHSMNKNKNQEIYRLVNVEGTKRLAEYAVKAGVKRLVFLSSIKVNGEKTDNTGKKFSNNNLPNPQDPYSISKLEAEKILWDISAETDLEVVIVRLPLVYGYGAKGNLKNLMQLVNFGIPLPFSFINNRRSLIGIDNLIDLLISCIDHPEAKGKTFLVSDDEDLSTPDLINYIASAMGRSARLFPLPISLLKFLGFCIGRSNQINRLIGSLQLDIEQTRKTLNWSPQVSAREGIRRMVQGK
jgi:nucleoside-diphosphate-sugar epimerase